MATVFLTLAFEFSNGWLDAANSIATVVYTPVLTPFRAVSSVLELCCSVRVWHRGGQHRWKGIGPP
jgi:phosphate/sulfate permease